MLELARLLSADSLTVRVDFVAYTLEEPPFYKTQQMGSYIHAKSLFASGIDVEGMICLEMIGYFNDSPRSQKYPLRILRLFYGNKGDFITVVQKYNNGDFGRKVKRNMMQQNFIRTKSFKSFKKLPGVDFSDHRNYWAFGHSAVMITNTAFYRNNNYHKTSDTFETLDTERMCKVIDAVYLSILNMYRN
jgi:hypothetical protein